MHLRLAQGSGLGGLPRLAAASFVLFLLVACGSPEDLSGDYSVGVDVTPAAPVSGAPAAVAVRLGRGTADEPWGGARLELEAHMSHPGMAPIVVPLVEREGAYRAAVTFTMAGEWTLLVTGTLPDGRRIRHDAGTHPVTTPR